MRLKQATHNAVRWFHKKKLAILVAVVFLFVGAGTGAYLALMFYNPPVILDQHEQNSQYQFVSPLLSCGTDQNIDADQAQDLQDQLQNAVKSHEDAGDITTASVYFRDLNGGPYVDLNADQPFSPGSLLKVPLAMSVYKEAESDPTILTKMLDYTATETDDPQYFAPATTFTPGNYPVQQLVTQMLENSDNNAANVLATFIGVSSFEATYQHIGIPAPPAQGDNYTTTTRNYGSFFTVLYNATYLNADDSEHLLNLLSQTSFTQGIVAGVPKGTIVSHKFGERSFSDSSLNELHDCGIVYAPNHPYLICIMTQGYNYPALASTIADLSNVTYNYVE